MPTKTDPLKTNYFVTEVTIILCHSPPDYLPKDNDFVVFNMIPHSCICDCSKEIYAQVDHVKCSSDNNP